MVFWSASHHPKLRHSTTFWDTILSISKGQPENQRDLSTSSVSTQLFPREPTTGGCADKLKLVSAHFTWKLKEIFVPYPHHLRWRNFLLKIQMPMLLLMWRNWYQPTRYVPCLVRYRKCFQQRGRGGNSMNLKQLAAKGALSVHPLILFWPSN